MKKATIKYVSKEQLLEISKADEKIGELELCGFYNPDTNTIYELIEAI